MKSNPRFHECTIKVIYPLGSMIYQDERFKGNQATVFLLKVRTLIADEIACQQSEE